MDGYTYPSETQLLFFYGEESIQTISSLSAAEQEQVFVGTSLWEVSENVLTDLRFSEVEAEHYLDVCVSVDQSCLQVVVVDTFQDGLNPPGFYSFAYGEEVLSGDGVQWGCRSYQFGSDCADPSRPNPVDCSYENDIVNVYPGGGRRL
jgi:hypothetical protein